MDEKTKMNNLISHILILEKLCLNSEWSMSFIDFTKD